MDENIRVSRDNTGMVLCLAINYGGRTELVDAAVRLAEQVKSGKLDPDDIDEQTIDDALYTAGMPEPDLLIRTAGEMRDQQFPSLADLVRRAVGHGEVLARFRPSDAAPRPCATSPAGNGVSADYE